MRGEEDTATSSEMRLDSGASTRTTVTAVAQPVFTCHSTCTGVLTNCHSTCTGVVIICHRTPTTV